MSLQNTNRDGLTDQRQADYNTNKVRILGTKGENKMTLTQKTVCEYCEENNLVITGWYWFNEETGTLDTVKEMPHIKEWQGATALVEKNESGIDKVNCFYTTKNIYNSYPRLRVRKNGKLVNVKR